MMYVSTTTRQAGRQACDARHAKAHYLNLSSYIDVVENRWISLSVFQKKFPHVVASAPFPDAKFQTDAKFW